MHQSSACCLTVTAMMEGPAAMEVVGAPMRTDAEDRGDAVERSPWASGEIVSDPAREGRLEGPARLMKWGRRAQPRPAAPSEPPEKNERGRGVQASSAATPTAEKL